MSGRQAVILFLCGLAFALWPAVEAATIPPADASPEVAAVAAGYANALATGDARKAYELLSTQSRAGLTEAQWQQAFEMTRGGRPVARKPPPSAVLRAIASAEPPPTVSEVMIRAGEAFAAVQGSVRVTQSLVLVREPRRNGKPSDGAVAGGWRIDLQATDRLNSRQAASNFLATLCTEAEMGRSRMGQEASLPLLRSLLASEARDYQVIEADVEGDRAQVTVAADVPINLVLRETRTGPGWSVDLGRPLLPIDISAPDPLQQAGHLADKMACEDQMQMLVRAIQMYANASSDLLPDPKRWLEQIRPYLQPGFTGHCPLDAMPGISYAMNRNLAGKRLKQLANPGLTVVLYESTLHESSPADAGESWPRPARHSEGNLAAYADNSVRASPRPPSFEVKDAPPGAGKVTMPGQKLGQLGAPMPGLRGGQAGQQHGVLPPPAPIRPQKPK